MASLHTSLFYVVLQALSYPSLPLCIYPGYLPCVLWPHFQVIVAIFTSFHGVCCKICDKRETSPTMHCYLRLGCSSDPCLVANKCDKCIYIHRSWSLLACELVMLYPRQYNHSHLIMNCQLLSLLPWEYKSFRVTQLLKRLLLYCITNIHASFL